MDIVWFRGLLLTLTK
jgi:hypothetical protein